jgi:hypothetical protein
MFVKNYEHILNAILKKFVPQSTFKLKLPNMKTNLLRAVLLTDIHFKFCSSDASEVSTVETKSQVVVNYTYSPSNCKQ